MSLGQPCSVARMAGECYVPLQASCLAATSLLLSVQLQVGVLLLSVLSPVSDDATSSPVSAGAGDLWRKRAGVQQLGSGTVAWKALSSPWLYLMPDASALAITWRCFTLRWSRVVLWEVPGDPGD